MGTTVSMLSGARDSGQGPMVVDVRTCGEFAAGHIPGAISVPMDEVEARLDDLPLGRPIVLACHSGNRAAMVCELIRKARPEADVLEGGTEAWEQAGLPIVASTRTRWSLDRQVRLGAGAIVLLGTLLSVFMSSAWVYVAMFIGAGLTFSGLTNFCGMAALLAQMPWNKPRSGPAAKAKAEGA